MPQGAVAYAIGTKRTDSKARGRILFATQSIREQRFLREDSHPRYVWQRSGARLGFADSEQTRRL